MHPDLLELQRTALIEPSIALEELAQSATARLDRAVGASVSEIRQAIEHLGVWGRRALETTRRISELHARVAEIASRQSAPHPGASYLESVLALEREKLEIEEAEWEIQKLEIVNSNLSDVGADIAALAEYLSEAEALPKRMNAAITSSRRRRAGVSAVALTLSGAMGLLLSVGSERVTGATVGAWSPNLTTLASFLLAFSCEKIFVEPYIERALSARAWARFAQYQEELRSLLARAGTIGYLLRLHRERALLIDVPSA